MNKILRYSLVCLLTLIGGMVYADEVTFDFSANAYGMTVGDSKNNVYNAADTKVSEGDITLIANEKTRIWKATTQDYRMVTGGKTTISCAAGKVIKKITFSGKNLTSMSADLGTMTGNATSQTWEGNVSEVTVSKTGSSTVQISKMVITVEGGSAKAAAGLSFGTESTTIEKGQPLFAPSFTKKTTAPVTFTSDNENVATVNSEGVISLTGGLGTAVITATSPENDAYQAGKATYTIKVYSNYIYKKATAIVSGKKYIIVAINGDTKKVVYPLSSDKTYGDPSSGNVTIEDEQITLSTLHDDNFSFEAAEGGYTIMDCYGRYVFRKGTYNNFNVHKSPNVPYVWTVEPQTDGTFKISMDGYYMQYTTKLNCFTDAQENAVMPCLFELVEDPTGISSVNADKKNDGKKYNLNGQRVNDDYKGVYIMNGKKYLSK